MQVCPHCFGRGRYVQHVGPGRRALLSDFKRVPCGFCGSDGRVEDAEAERYCEARTATDLEALERAEMRRAG